MKGYDEILTIIRDQLGLADLAAYKLYCDTFINWDKPRASTPDERALLDPDIIDNRAFWEVAEFLFQTDPVSNCEFGTPRSKEESSKANIYIYHWDQAINTLKLVEKNKPNAVILEIGPGYGTLRDWVATNTKFQYYGIDVHPKIDGVDEAERTGLMGAVTKLRKYDVAVSCNVFQHLSINQRRAYYRDVAEVLVEKGWFVVSMWVDDRPKDYAFRDSEGKLYIRHYGQFTEIQTRADWVNDLHLYFDIQCETIRDNGWISFVCRKKVLTPAPTPVTI